MVKSALALLTTLVCSVGAQTPPASRAATTQSMQALVGEIAAYPRDNHQTRRLTALVVASAMQLDALDASRSREAEAFRASFTEQLRRARATLNLLGENSLTDMRGALADNLQRFGTDRNAFEHLMGAVADRESNGSIAGAPVRALVAAAIQAWTAATDRAAASRLLIEAAAVVRIRGEDAIALAGLQTDLSRLR